jgi:hypothetical protein
MPLREVRMLRAYVHEPVRIGGIEVLATGLLLLLLISTLL